MSTKREIKMSGKFKAKNQIPGNVRPQVVGNELTKLAKIHKGELKPKDIVDAARDEKSPIHKCFEWDNDFAAEKYRVEQARYLLRVIVVEYEVPEQEEPITLRVFENTINEDHESVYVRVVDAIKDTDQTKYIMMQALGDLKAFAHKYSNIEILLGLFSEIRKYTEILESEVNKK